MTKINRRGKVGKGRELRVREGKVVIGKEGIKHRLSYSEKNACH